ncbi:MAG: class II D-tagatose-bisphosphate aldolase non-catalytic subunit [Pseudorhodobacter sp.]
MSDLLRSIIARNRKGAAAAIPSVCSAHADVLRASLLLAEKLDRPLVVEATSNQVNQFGGYTGMRPSDFAAFVARLAREMGVDRDRIVLGGDHLGPQVWRAGPADAAMDHAIVMVADYARAGFTKIHLDCSEGCMGEPAQVDDATAAERSALLAEACDGAAPDAGAMAYVIGTEVPPPGGARAEGQDDGPHPETIAPTTPEAARATLAAHRAAFAARRLDALWPRVCGLVVQPGVEFSATAIHHLPIGDGAALRSVLDDWPGMGFEAHSTDYQHPEAYPRLAGQGFAIHKVGPALTFAFRKAVYGLDMIARTAGLDLKPLPEVMEQAMLARPEFWQRHYAATDAAQHRLLRHFSYADRIRYYWREAEACDAIDRLFAALKEIPIPVSALAQCFGPEVIDRAQHLRDRYLEPARALVAAEVQMALRPYFFGTGNDR